MYVALHRKLARLEQVSWATLQNRVHGESGQPKVAALWSSSRAGEIVSWHVFEIVVVHGDGLSGAKGPTGRLPHVSHQPGELIANGRIAFSEAPTDMPRRPRGVVSMWMLTFSRPWSATRETRSWGGFPPSPCVGHDHGVEAHLLRTRNDAPELLRRQECHLARGDLDHHLLRGVEAGNDDGTVSHVADGPEPERRRIASVVVVRATLLEWFSALSEIGQRRRKARALESELVARIRQSGIRA